jgi:hypothetical protein
LGNERLLLLLRRSRYGRQRRMAGTRPQLYGARPRIVDGGPAPGGEADGLGASSLLLRLLLCGAAATPAASPATTATPAAALAAAIGFGAGAVPSARLWWWRRVQQPVKGGRLPKVSSSKDRSSFTCRKVEKGRARHSRAPTCVKRSLRPRRTLRTRVRSVTTSPRAVRSSAIFFRRRQYSVTERSPCTKLRNFVSSWITRVSRLPRNWDSTASQASRAVAPWEETISARSSVRESRI